MSMEAIPPTSAPEAVAPTPEAPAPAETSSRRRTIGRIFFGERQAVVGAVVLAFFVAVAVAAPIISPHGQTEKVGSVYASPSPQHWLGLDDGGIDMLTLLIWGARVSLLVGFAASIMAIFIGGSIGILSGHLGGRTDMILMRITDYFLVIPDVPLMIVAAAIWGQSLFNIVVIIAVIYWTGTARLIRAQVKSVRERVYVKRARSLGAGSTRLILKHVLPQVAPLLVANTVLTVAIAIFAETYIAFLGLGDPSQVSWGGLIENSLAGGAIFRNAWWAIVPPGVCVTLVILACTMVGQSMEDALNPRLRVGHLSVRRFRMRPLKGKLDQE
jgi:peptide/nickel transport system permease protein